MNKVYLALPCFNPSVAQWKLVEEFYNSLKKYSQIGLEFDLAIIDDGSPHWVGPHESFKNAFTLIRLPKNHGKGFAVSEGLKSARGDYSIFAFMDFDLPYSADDLARLCSSVASGADLAIGDRTCWWQVTNTGKISRQISHIVFRFLMRTMVIGAFTTLNAELKPLNLKQPNSLQKKLA